MEKDRYAIARWLAAGLIAISMPGFLVGFAAQVISFVGFTGTGPIPDLSSTINDLIAFSQQAGFTLVVGASLGVVLSLKGEDIPGLGTAAWYVHLVGHELVHAIFAKLCGYEIREFKLTRDGGYVAYYKRNSRGNFLIDLSPYLFPIIPIMLLVAAYLVSGVARSVVILLLGISLGSHIAGTADEALEQYDVRQAGVFFSITLIMACNIALLMLVMVVVAPGRVSIADFLRTSVDFDIWYLSALARSIGELI
jgi:hypothetical protein